MKSLHKEKLIYTGKAKSLYTTADPDYLIMEFRDDTSAFDGIKKASLSRKGQVNNAFNAFIMEKLAAAGIVTQYERRVAANESLVKHLHMLPIECVIRNRAAGHLCSRLGVAEGLELNPPTLEFFLKNDALHDPMINESLIHTFSWAKDEEVALMKELSYRINEILLPLFSDVGFMLVDFKLEFGLFKGQIVLGDEFSPDGCRIWDAATGKKMDKDRFRKDLGDVIESYEEVAKRLGVVID